MHQTRLKNQKTIKVVPDDHETSVPGGVITGDRLALPPNCYIVPMTVLEKPIPIRKSAKKRK
jgi:hypothetical protein